MPQLKKRRALIALAILLLPALAAAAPARPAPKNLLANPSFETSQPGHDWMPAAWDTSDAGQTTVFFGRDSLLAHEGRWSVNIANTSMVYAMSHNWSQTMLVGRETWGKVAVLSVWTRSSGVEGRAYILVQAYRDTITHMAQIWGVDRDEAARRMMINKVDDPLIDFGWKRLAFDDAETGWVRREVRIPVAPGTNVLFVRCGLIGTGQLFVDDASLVLEPAPPLVTPAVGVNLLADPGFEAGGNAWEWMIPPYQGARLERDTTVAHDGHVSIRASNMIEGMISTRMGMCQPIPARALRGRHVRLSGWMKGDSLISTAYVMLYCHTQHGVEKSPSSKMMSMTFDWTKVSADMDVPADTEEIWAWIAFNAPAAGTVWFDDVAVEVTGPATGPPPPAGTRGAKGVKTIGS